VEASFIEAEGQQSVIYLTDGSEENIYLEAADGM
jgi:hypothetical protein